MMEMAKMLIFSGIGITATGVMFLFLSRLSSWKLPGDILVRKENFTFYFPVATCILLSIIISVIINLFRK